MFENTEQTRKRKLYFDEIENCILVLLIVPFSPNFPNNSKSYLLESAEKIDHIVDLNTKKNMGIKIGFNFLDIA